MEDEPQVQTWLEEGQEWFCERHYVLKGTPPEGTEQFCVYCEREKSVSLFAADPDGDSSLQDIYCWTYTNTLITISTFTGDDGVIIYGLPDGYVTPMSNMGYVYVGLYFEYSSPWQPKDLYDGASFTFYYGTDFTSTSGDRAWKLSSLKEHYASSNPVSLWKSDSLCFASTEPVSDFNIQYIGDWGAFYDFGESMNSTFATSGRSMYLAACFRMPDVDLAMPMNMGFYFTSPYTDPDGGTSLQPDDPGFDILGGIFEIIQKILESIINLPENIANAVKGFFDMVVNAIVQLGQTILDGLKSLFIPSDGYFEGVASDMQAWLEDHLGLLVYPFTLVADLASRIAAVEGGEPTAHIPEIAYTDGGDKYVLIAEQEVNLYDQVGRNETFIELHQLYLMAMDAAIGGALAFLAWKKFDQITGGSST